MRNSNLWASWQFYFTSLDFLLQETSRCHISIKHVSFHLFILFSYLMFLFIPKISIFFPEFLSSFILCSTLAPVAVFITYANVSSLKPPIWFCLFSRYWRISFLFLYHLILFLLQNTNCSLRRVCALKTFSKWFKVWLTTIVFFNKTLSQ